MKGALLVIFLYSGGPYPPTLYSGGPYPPALYSSGSYPLVWYSPGPDAAILLRTDSIALLPRSAVSQETVEAPRVTQQEFRKLFAAKSVVIVDTRTADAFAQSHIPGAVLLPLEGQLTWPEAYQQSVVDKLKSTTRPIVTYCA